MLGSETYRYRFVSSIDDDPKTTARRTNLVEVLQEIHYPALNLLLREARGDRIESDGRSGEAWRELRRPHGWGTSDLDGDRSPHGARHGGPQRADNGGTEHVDE